MFVLAAIVSIHVLVHPNLSGCDYSFGFEMSFKPTIGTSRPPHYHCIVVTDWMFQTHNGYIQIEPAAHSCSSLRCHFKQRVHPNLVTVVGNRLCHVVSIPLRVHPDRSYCQRSGWCSYVSSLQRAHPYPTSPTSGFTLRRFKPTLGTSRSVRPPDSVQVRQVSISL